MLALLTWDSPSLWPLSLGIAAVLTSLVLWLYPGQVSRLGLSGWAPPLLRWVAVVIISLSILKPVVLQPKGSDETGAVVILLDRSRSMGVTDTGRSPEQWVALARSLGRLPPDVRSTSVVPMLAQLEQLDSRAQDVLNAQSDLDYARLSGRGISEKQKRREELASSYADAARTLSAQSETFPEGSELRCRLKEVVSVPDERLSSSWADEVKPRIHAAQEAARAFQAAADEKLYKLNADVRVACQQLAGLPRLSLAEEVLLHPGTGLIARLGPNAPVVGFSIDRGLTPLFLTRYGHPVAAPALTADDAQSDITGAVAAAVNNMSGRLVRAIVLLSDGRQVGGRGDLTSSLHPSGVPVFTVGLAPEQTPDVSIVSVSLPASAFAGETIEGDAEVRYDGPVPVPSELHVSAGKSELVERLIARPPARRPQHGKDLEARFSVPIDVGGEAARRITFSVPPAPGEATTENNRVERWIKVSSERLKVATCTAAPTWDYQYLTGLLSRRAWVRLDNHVLDPAHPKLAMSPAQIVDQDVLVLDDVPVGALDAVQWDAISQLVQVRGGSVILIPGTAFSISDYAHQPLALSLLPFNALDPSAPRPSWRRWPGEQPAFHFVPTPAGEREALRIGPGQSSLRVWQELPGVYRYLQLPDKGLRPDAQKLLVEADSGAPVLLERRLGAGRVLFLGLDETWRWRLKGGEEAADQFWRQLVRYAAGEPYAASQGSLALDLDRVAAEPGQSVYVRARVRDARFPLAAARSCEIDVLRDGKRLTTRQLRATGGGRFAGELRDLPEGDYQIEFRGASSDGAAVAARVPLHVALSSEAEMRDVSGDADLLTRIARSTGGRFYPIEQFDQLPRRILTLPGPESQFVRWPLWNSPFLFAFVLACFAGEWALRKRFGLV